MREVQTDFAGMSHAYAGDDELIIDSFAGGGGASTGIELALGRSPEFAINHDPEALALHAANHPNTVHLSKNIYKVDPMDVVGKRKVGLLWASPDCKHFSKAKGGKPVKREIRDLAWTVVLWAERVAPRVIILENVEEFQTWGPLVETDRGIMPCPDRKGETFNEWVGALRKLGYKVEWKELRACDFGAPTTRKRLFLIARRDGKKIVWPTPTHGAGKLPYRTAASHVIDWSIPCPSIFDTSDEIMAKWGVRAIRPLAENTLARIAKGVKRYVLDAAKPFIVTCNHGGDWFRGQDIGQPFHTVTAARDAHGLVMPHLMTMRNAGKPFNEVDKPTHTVTAGGAGLSLVAPLLAGVGGRAGQSRPRSADEPTATGTTKADTVLVAPLLSSAQHGGSHRAVDEPHRTIAATMVQTGYGEREGQLSDVEAPAPTVTADGTHQAEVRAFLMKYYGNEIDGHDPGAPIGTVTTKDRFGIVTVEGEPYQIVDIGMRMLTPRELFNAQGFPPEYEIETGVFADGSRRALTKTAQVRMCGNSVCPPIAAALVSANCADMAVVQNEAAA